LKIYQLDRNFYLHISEKKERRGEEERGGERR